MFSIMCIWNHYIYRDNHALMSFCLILDIALSVLLVFFNIWNWFLACSGLSTIEFMGQASGYKENRFDYSFSRVRDNLFKVFGTKSYFAVLSPSLRQNMFSGIEWSFQMIDLGFNEYGELAGAEDDEEGERGIRAPEAEMVAVDAVEKPKSEDALECEDAEIAI